MVPSLLRLPRPLTRFCARLLLLTLSAATLHGVHGSVGLELPIIHVERAHHVDAAAASEPSGSRERCLACQLVRTPCGPVALECSALVVVDFGHNVAHLDWPVATARHATPAPVRGPPLSA